MGHRQLALIAGLLTAIVALGIAAIRMMMGLSAGIGVGLTLALYLASSIVLLLIGKKKWELGYMNAFAMLFSASLICGLVYAFGYEHVQDAFPEMKGEDDDFVFGGLLIVNVAPRLIIDAIVAIFQKRNS